MQHIPWYFNPLVAPHFRSAWERLIRSFKDTFYKIVESRTLRDSTHYTFACEVEAIMNNRLLLHVSSDVTNMEPLTSNNLLLGRPQANVPTGIFESDKEPYSWKEAQVLADSFWSRCIKDYMPSLQTRSKWTKNSDELIPGGLVWILEDFTDRGIWRVGKIKSVTKDTNNVTCSYELISPFGTIKRPVI